MPDDAATSTQQPPDGTTETGAAWFLAAAALTALLSFVVVWAYILAFPMAFLEGGYPAWVAKERMIAECDLGDLAVFGDSQAQAGFVPLRLPGTVSNFALPAGAPIETYVAVKRALACPRPPRLVVLSMSMVSFSGISPFFWTNSLRYGFIGPADLSEVTDAAQKLGDLSVATATSRDGFHGVVRNVLYLMHFPPLYFGNLVQGQVFRRQPENLARLDATLTARGFIPFDAQDPNDDRAEPPPAQFASVPINDYFFERTLALLRDRGISVEFVMMPMRDDRFRQLPPDALARFKEYLGEYAARYANFRVGASVASWPAALYVDAEHLGPKGAELFSDRFAACLAQGASVCDLAWGARGAQ
jgi:hypothetical protein